MEHEPTTRFIITVDTETYAIDNTPPPFQANIYANLPEGIFGVQRIMDTCGRYGAKATFFVDVYMHHHYGKEPVRDLCKMIDDAGHDVQLHAHTSWLPGSTSGKLSDFSLEEQVDIIAEGKRLIGDWIGKNPVAFRAGAYTADLNTIAALEQNEFIIDSSYFAFNRNCELSYQLGKKVINRPFYLGKLFEIPVTCYWLARGMGYQKLSKIDINACSRAEINDVIPKLVRANTKYVILFLHSFSFIRWNRDFTGIVPNYRALDRFESLLESISSAGCNTCLSTMAELASGTLRESPERGDFVPTARVSSLIPRAFLRLLESNG